MLLVDQFPNVNLTVSDIRESIIINLRNRFKTAGITSYQHFVADISAAGFSMKKKFDLVICDAPCSGSGTWGRTPEQLRYFTADRIDHYASLQKKIASKAAAQLEPGGYFLYITCSVFKKENEEVVAQLEAETAMRLVSSQYFTGYDKKADTLFAALFTL